MTSEGRRLLLACLATLAVLAPVGYLWQQSRVPSTYSVMDMGYLDYGGGPPGARDMAQMPSTTHDMGQELAGSQSVRDLTVGTDRRADKVVDLVARKGTVRLASGQRVEGYTVNGTSPGPLIEVTQGQLLEVHLRNANVADGVTLHWHGVDVPNAEDGVAGVTQDAVMPGREYTYRFVAHQSGTYWYHSHQVSHDQVVGGLLGPLVVARATAAPDVGADVVAPAHLRRHRDAQRHRRTVPVQARPGQRVRVRVVNSDNGPTRTWASAPYRVLAVDGHDVNKPTRSATGRARRRPGGRLDLVVAPWKGRRPGAGRRRHRARGRPKHRATAVPSAPHKEPGPALLRFAGPARLRPGQGRPSLRLSHRPTHRVRER